jgi:hypothetical protein
MQKEDAMLTRFGPPVLIVLTLAASLLGIAACTTLTDVPAPASYIIAKHPSSLWVETKSATVRVDSPRVMGDSITGTTDGQPFAAPLSDVTGATVRSIDWPVTDALIVGGAAVAWFAFTPSNDHSRGCGVTCVETMPGMNLCAGC